MISMLLSDRDRLVAILGSPTLCVALSDGQKTLEFRQGTLPDELA